MIRCGIPGRSPKDAPAMRHATVTETVMACVVGDSCIDRQPTACGGSRSCRVWGVVTPLTCYVSSGDGFPVRFRDTAFVPPCPSGQTGPAEGRVVSPSQVRILVAACRSLYRQTMLCIPCRRTQVVNGKRFRPAGVGPAEVRILAATRLSVVQRSRRLPVEEETHVRVVPERLGAVEEPGIHALTEFLSGDRCDGESSFISLVTRPRRFESCPPLWPMTPRARPALQWSRGQTHDPLPVEPPVQIRAGATTCSRVLFIARCGMG